MNRIVGCVFCLLIFLGCQPEKKDQLVAPGKVLQAQGKELLIGGEYKKAIEVNERAHKQLLLEKDTVSAAKAINNVGVGHFYLGDYYSCSKAYEKARMLHLLIGNDSLGAETGLNIAMIATEQGDYTKGLELLHTSINVLEESKSLQSASRGYNALGILYNDLGSDAACQKYYRRALQLQKSLSLELDVNKTLNNLGVNFLKTNQYDSAAHYLNLALSNADQLKSNILIANALRNLGELELQFNHLLEAEALLNQSLTHFEAGSGRKGIADVLQMQAKLMLLQKKAGVLPILNRGIAIAQEENMVQILLDLYATKSRYLTSNNRAVEALKVSELWIALKEKVSKDNLNRTLAQKEVYYDTARKEARIEMLNQLTEQKNRQIYYRNLALTGGVLLLVLVIFYALGAVKSRKYEVLLRQENQHRIANNLQMLSAQINNYKQHATFDQEKETAERIKGLIDTVGSMQRRLFNTPDGTSVSTQEYLQGIVEGVTALGVAKGQVVASKIQISNLIISERNLLYLGLIVNELVTNVCKYGLKAVANPCIEVTLKATGKQQGVLVVEDNGPGTSDEVTGDGFGSDMIRKLAIQLKGEISISRENGFHYQLLFPLELVPKKKGAGWRLFMR